MFPCFSIVKKSELTYLCVDDYIGFFLFFVFVLSSGLGKPYFPVMVSLLLCSLAMLFFKMCVANIDYPASFYELVHKFHFLRAFGKDVVKNLKLIWALEFMASLSVKKILPPVIPHTPSWSNLNAGACSDIV